MIKHPNFDGDMASFDNTNVQFPPKLHFHINALKFVLGCIPNIYAKSLTMKNKVDNTPSSTECYFQQVFHLKH